MSVINQKEYLKKYLGLGKQPREKKKKRRKERKALTDGLKIIDDDLDVTISQEIQIDLTAETEDAPQVVAVIDERPLHLQIDEQTNRKLWEPIGRSGQSSGWVEVDEKKNESLEKNWRGSENEVKEESVSPPRKTRNSSPPTYRYNENSSPDRNLRDHRSLSPSRNGRNLSPPVRKYTGNNYDSFSEKKCTRKPSQDDLLSDSKPVRKRKLSPPSTDLSPSKKHSTIDDLSPARKLNRSLSPRNRDSSLKKGNSNFKRTDVDDLSPIRRQIKKENMSPPPRHKDSSPRRKDSSRLLEGLSKKCSSLDDLSPVRKHSRRSSSTRKDDLSLKRDASDAKRSDVDDLSPIRRRIKKENTTSPRHKDLSPPRRKISSHTRSFVELSPVKRYIKKQNMKSPPPPPRNRDLSPSSSFDNLSPVKCESKGERDSSNIGTSSSVREEKKYDDHVKQKQSRWKECSPEPKQAKTLSGKKAGLQNARELIEEIKAAKKREDIVFRNLTEEQSGRHATTIVRNQKSDDPEVEARKMEEEREIKERYNKWGKGLKQVENDNQKLADEIYEMTKPLARYADDKDLERYLKEQEREGDPMLDYIRKKKKKKVVADGIPEKPTYMGEFMPNRFGIQPGYRWDGVDRSNGYEKKYFEVQNSRRAMQEDAFKWSTEDM